MITRHQILTWLRVFAQVLQENRELLTELDAAIGDADHGINMDRGFKKVLSQLSEVEEKDIGSILKATGMALISGVGGAGGPLYGTFFLRAAAVADGKTELSDDDLAKLLEAGVQGVIQRGKAEPGDKTMIDALLPAVEALKQATSSGVPTHDALHQAVFSAEQGMKATIPMQAKKGRASYLGERSIGHQDPGATSSYLMLKTLAEVVCKS